MIGSVDGKSLLSWDDSRRDGGREWMNEWYEYVIYEMAVSLSLSVGSARMRSLKREMERDSREDRNGWNSYHII